MLRLHGFPISNYYNMVKTVLIEKGIEFEEVIQPPAQDDPRWLEMSPMGKIPALETPDGSLAETMTILEYLEETTPTPAMLPTDAMDRARVRQIAHHAIYYIDLAMRPGLPIALFGAPENPAVAELVERETTRGTAAMGRIATFDGWLAGGDFGLADVVTGWCIPLASVVCQKLCDIDLTASRPELVDYMARFSERASVQRCNADREAAMAARAARG